MFNYNGKVVVVSGASSGLGKQMARAFAKQGANLVITARRIEKLEELSNEIKAMGVDCLPIKCDVTNVAEVNEAARVAEEHYGKVDVLVNCAGSAKNAGVLEMTPSAAPRAWSSTLSRPTTANSSTHTRRTARRSARRLASSAPKSRTSAATAASSTRRSSWRRFPPPSRARMWSARSPPPMNSAAMPSA